MSRAASDAQTAGVGDDDVQAEHRLGPKRQLSRSALSAPEADHSFDQDVFAAEPRPRKIFSVVDYSAFDDLMSESSISLEDVGLEFGDESGMTIHDMNMQPAICFADDGAGMSSEEVQRWASLTRSDSNAESSLDSESDGCMVSAHSFEGDSTDDECQEIKGADGEDWEML